MYSIYQISDIEIPPIKHSDIYIFCKENGIECGYDWNHRIGKWTEIYLDGELVLQIDWNATIKQFLEYISIQSKSFKCEGEIDLSGEDIWIACEEEELFIKFIQKYHSLIVKE